MMTSLLLKQDDNPSRLKQTIDRNFERLRNGYAKALHTALSLRVALLTGSLFLIVLVFPLYMFSMKELAPKEDQGVVFGIVQAAPNATLEQTTVFTEMVYERFASFPEHARTFQLTNPQGGFSGMLTVPWSERSRTTTEIEGEAWGRMTEVPGIRVIVITPAPLPGGSDFPIEFVFSSTDEPEKLFQYAGQFVGAAFASGRFMFADSDLQIDLPQSRIVIDREKVALLGLDMRSVGTDLASFTGGNFVNRFNIQGRSYKVIPQAQRSERLNPEQLLNMHTVTPTGERVPFSAFAHIEQRVQPRELKRFQQLNSVMIQGAVVPGVSIDQGLAVLEDLAKEILPAGYMIDYAGESRQLRAEGNKLTGTLLAALVVIFLLLAAQFESFRDPLIILGGSVPLALAGALIFVFLGFTSLNIYSQVGLVTLVGLVSKNGILIVEFANALREEGKSIYEAIFEASVTRFRPVMMTSVATVVGHTPLIFASGPGAGARNSIGWVLVTGMFIGTFFTLFIVPVLYTVLSSRNRSLRPGPQESAAISDSQQELSNGAKPMNGPTVVRQSSLDDSSMTLSSQ
jgi:multidrug efflux pump